MFAHVCVCVCGTVYLDGSLIEKSWWLGPRIKGLQRSRTASGSNNAASNPSLPQRTGPGWQPTAIFTTLLLLLTSLHFSFPPFSCHFPVGFCFKIYSISLKKVDAAFLWILRCQVKDKVFGACLLFTVEIVQVQSNSVSKFLLEIVQKSL